MNLTSSPAHDTLTPYPDWKGVLFTMGSVHHWYGEKQRVVIYINKQRYAFTHNQAGDCFYHKVEGIKFLILNWKEI